MTTATIATNEKESPAAVTGTRERECNGILNLYKKNITHRPLIVKLNVDTHGYATKPAGAEYGAIRKRMTTRTLDAQRLFNGVLKGISFTPAALTGTSGDSWTEQQLFAVDIDNKGDGDPLTVEKAVAIMDAAGINPLFGYNTYSHSEALPRFRIVIAADQPVTDKQEAIHITQGFQALFPGVDESTKDAARLFLGTNKGPCIPYTAKTNPAEKLIALYHERVEPQQQMTVTSTAQTRPAFENDLALAIEQFDMAAYVSRTTGARGTQRGAKMMFSPCPLCGHNDDFYAEGGLWKCFGSNGPGRGGNIINYLEALHGYTREQARGYFMYDIMGWPRTEQKHRGKVIELNMPRTAVENAVKERPAYVLTRRRRDPATGDLVEAEYISPPRLAQFIREREHYFFLKAGLGTVLPYWYEDGVYREALDDEIRGRIKQHITSWNPDLLRMKDVEEVYRDLRTDLCFKKMEDINANAEYTVNFKNGIYNTITGEFSPHNPENLCTVQLPVNYPEDIDMTGDQNAAYEKLASKTLTFQKLIHYLAHGPVSNPHPEGGRRETFLMEWMAAILSNIPGWRFKKSLWMHGPGDSGKSKLLELVCFLLGEENVYSTDISRLEERFGAAGCYGRRLVCIPDMRFLRVPELSLFKSLTGGDLIPVERKGRDSFGYKFSGLTWFCMNRLPRFGGDQGEHVYRRMILFETPQSLPENEQDPDLMSKLRQEAPYIAVLIAGYIPIIIGNGCRFDLPGDADVARNSYAAQNDAVLGWLKDCCIDTQNPQTDEEQATVAEWMQTATKPTIKNLYDCFVRWCNDLENGYHSSYTDWKHRLKEIAGTPGVKDAEFAPHRKNGAVMTRYCLNAAAAEDFDYIIRRGT